jgi:hypothetical protein
MFVLCSLYLCVLHHTIYCIITPACLYTSYTYATLLYKQYKLYPYKVIPFYILFPNLRFILGINL